LTCDIVFCLTLGCVSFLRFSNWNYYIIWRLQNFSRCRPKRGEVGSGSEAGLTNYGQEANDGEESPTSSIVAEARFVLW